MAWWRTLSPKEALKKDGVQHQGASKFVKVIDIGCCRKSRMEIDANVAVTFAKSEREESDSDAEPQRLAATKGQTE
jgi:hypothetical protein